MGAVFKFSTETTSIEVEGPEEFLREQVVFLAPFVGRVTGAATGAAPSGSGIVAGLDGLPAWWTRCVPGAASPSIQDAILLCAYYMRTYRKTVFLSEDIRRCFQLMGMEEPRSLLQILGNLRREHGLLLNAGKRGEYMMNTTGIARAREILGEVRPVPAPAPSIRLEPLPERKLPDVRSIFKD